MGKTYLKVCLLAACHTMSNIEQVYILAQLLTQLLVDYQLCAREQVRLFFSKTFSRKRNKTSFAILGRIGRFQMPAKDLC